MRKPIGRIRNEAEAKRVRRKLSIRKKIEGTAERPRVCVTRSNKHLRVQVIDDTVGKTLASAQTYGKNAAASKPNKEGAKALGTKVAEQLKAKSVGNAVFDRQGHKFAGVLKTLVDSIREGGVQI